MRSQTLQEMHDALDRACRESWSALEEVSKTAPSEPAALESKRQALLRQIAMYTETARNLVLVLALISPEQESPAN